MSQPLTDAITALTTYANTVTSASDTTLSDAVATLAAGYGGGGGSVTTSFALKDYKVASAKWVINSGIANLIKTGGCLHIKMTVPASPVVSNDSEVLSIGGDALSNWSPTTNCSIFGAIYPNIDDIGKNSFGLRLRGSTLNAWIKTYYYMDANGKIDLKYYSDRFVDVLTNTTYYYSNPPVNDSSDYTSMTTAMTNLCTRDYISVGCNQMSNRWSSNVVELYAIEAS